MSLKRLFLAVAFVSALLIGVSSAFSGSTVGSGRAASAATGLRLLFSSSADRSSPQALEGAELSGKVAIFTSSWRSVSSVGFYLDDPELAKAPATLELKPQFDFAGTAANADANLFDTSKLAAGEHQLSAKVTFTSGEKVVVEAAFSKKGALPAPPPVDPGEPAPPAGACSAPANTPGGSDGSGGCFPGPNNTGVPSGTKLTTYDGPCTITAANTVIDSKIVNCALDIRTTGVVIRKSEIHGHVQNREGSANSFRIEDSFVDGSPKGPVEDRAIAVDGFTVVRTEVVGGNGGIYCRLNCTVQDSWVHGTDLDPNSEWHASAVRVEQRSTLVHNSLACDWTQITNSEIGCSADMTGYPDFAPITHNTIDGNLFVANPVGLGFCAYGGGTGGKPYSTDPNNATYIVFRDNVFQRGTNGKCGTYGAVTDFVSSRTGNVWENNRWSDGTAVKPG